ncbi:MAG: hypothetical protein ACFFAS_00820 [Promethearchaeota archaeon]
MCECIQIDPDKKKVNYGDVELKMLSVMFNGITSSPYFPMMIGGMVLLVMATTWIPILKIGLIITNAEKNREWKFVAASAFMQAGAVFFVMFPMFMMMLLNYDSEDGGGGPPDFGLMFGLMGLGLFIDLNILNVFHRIGLKRAFVVFIIEFVPVIIIMSITLTMSMGGNGGP